MRKLQKILMGTFLGGILLGGIGTGIAFVEYSSITYAGEKKIGQESTVTKDLEFPFDHREGIVNVASVWYDNGKVSYAETDPSVPEGVVRYRVTYNERLVNPYLYFSEYEEKEEETEAETEWTEENRGPGYENVDFQAEETEGSESDDGRLNVIEAPDPEKQPSRYQGELYLRYNYRDDFGLWMENKDEILSDLKQGRIASYRVDNITDVRILVNPATEKFIKQIRE